MLSNVSTTGLLASAHALQDHLAQRVGFEQSHLLDVLDAIGHGVGVPLFNAYINILDSSPPSSFAEGEELLTPYHLPDIAGMPKQRCDGAKTSVDGLETGFLAEENVYLDIVTDGAGDRLDLVMRCDSGAIDQEEADEFLEAMMAVVEGFV